MSFPAGTHPAGSPSADTGKFLHAFQAGETLTFTIANYGNASTYEVRNFYGTIVSAGSIAGPTLVLPDLGLGWYKLYLTHATVQASPWGTCGGELCFCVVRSDADSPLIDRPGQTAAFTSTGGDIGAHIPARGYFGLGPFRHKIATLADTSGVAGAANEIAYEISTRQADTARLQKPLTAFPNGYNGESANLTTAVQACVAQGGVWFEGRNEPNTAVGATTYPTEFKAFADVVHAAHASAKVLGPSMLGVSGDATDGSGGNLLWLNTFLAQSGVTSRLDGISFHNYDSHPGDLVAQRKVFDKFVAVLTSYGLQNLPRWNTEFGSTIACAYGSFTPHWQTKNTMLDLHIHEQYGVPKEQLYLFYDLSHGFWGFPAFFVMRESTYGQTTPLVPLIRVWSEELFGRTFAARLNFGSEDDLWIGSRFTGVSDSVVALQSSGHVGNVRLTVTGATSVTTVDPWGRTTMRAVTGGTVSVPVDTLPTYIRCPAGVTATPVATDYGVDVVKAGVTTFAASTNNTDAKVAFDGDETADWSKTGAATEWIGGGGSLPATITVTFPKVQRFNRVAVLGPAPHNLTCAITDGAVQARIGGVWTTISTISETPTYKMWTSANEAGGNFVDSYWTRRNQWVFRYDTAYAADAVRVLINATSYGGEGTNDSFQGAGATLNGGGDIGQGGPQIPTIREIRVTLNEYDLAGKSTLNAPLVAIA